MSCAPSVSHCWDFLMLASRRSSQPCDEIPSWVAASIITENGLQWRDVRGRKWILLMGKYRTKWDMRIVECDARRVWEKKVGIDPRLKTRWTENGSNPLQRDRPVEMHSYFVMCSKHDVIMCWISVYTNRLERWETWHCNCSFKFMGLNYTVGSEQHWNDTHTIKYKLSVWGERQN